MTPPGPRRPGERAINLAAYPRRPLACPKRWPMPNQSIPTHPDHRSPSAPAPGPRYRPSVVSTIERLYVSHDDTRAWCSIVHDSDACRVRLSPAFQQTARCVRPQTHHTHTHAAGTWKRFGSKAALPSSASAAARVSPGKTATSAAGQRVRKVLRIFGPFIRSTRRCSASGSSA